MHHQDASAGWHCGEFLFIDIMLNCAQKHKEAYNFAIKTLDFALTKFVPGATFGSIYDEVYTFVEKEKPDFAGNMLHSLGHTMGLEFKDANFTVVRGNDRCIVEAGMVFHVSLGFSQLEDNGKEFAVWIGDTVEVASDGAKVLTSNVSKSLENVSYELEEDEEEQDEKSESKVQKQPSVSSDILRDAESVILKERLRNRDRSGQAQVSEAEMKARMERQMDLRKKKIDAIAQRIKEEGGLAGAPKQRQTIKMDKMRSFSTPNSFAADIVPQQVGFTPYILYVI